MQTMSTYWHNAITFASGKLTENCGELKRPEVVCLWPGFHFGVNLVVALWGKTDTANTIDVFHLRELLKKQLKTRKRVYLLFGTHQNTSFNRSILPEAAVYVNPLRDANT